jgi:hypothetical protein
MTSLLRGLALAVLCATPVMAQSWPQTRTGTTIGVGVGAGSARLVCDGCDSGRQTTPVAYFRVAGVMAPNLALGFEINGSGSIAREGDDDAKVRVATLAGIAQWYPVASRGLFLYGGLGLASLSFSHDLQGGGETESRAIAIAYQLGAGYDVRLGRDFSLTPFGKLLGTNGGKVEGVGESFNANIIQVGLGFTWH